jgi:hypothetical protein
MALIIKDRVKEVTTSTGTGAVSLGGASATFDAFQSVMSNGDTTFYAIVHTASATDEWEVGLGTWNTGNTLTRTTVYAGSSGTSAVNFSSGNKDVFMTYPAGKAAVTGEDVTFADITVTGTVDGRDVATDGTKLDTIETSADVTDATNVAAAGALMKSGGTMTGNLILNADPTTALGAATKEYVDTIAAAGIHYHTPVRVEAPSALTATYDNGTSGVGATLTNSSTQAALVIDGITLSTSDRVLVYNQSNAAHNGIYTVTNTGSASTNWVLTRATDADSYAPSDPDALGEGDAYFVKEGDTGAGELYVMNTSGTITFGTTAITFAVIAETAVYSAGTGLTLTGTTFSTNQDISTSASPTFAGATVNGNITVTGTVDGRDVATDGTKLDGIEANADVTDTANVTAAGALMDSEVANLAQVKAFNSADYATAAQGTTADNALPKTGGTMTGNIVMSSTETVDGRDLSVDGAKLDGIESGATADQTAAEILTAIKTVDGAASGLDADLLDGQQGSYYLNTSTSFSGDVSGTYNAIVVADDSHTHDGRYYTETEADSRFVNASGDTMTGPLIIDTNTSGMLVLSATNGSPWAIDLQRDDATNSKVFNSGGQWYFEHRPSFAGNTAFDDGYHPNADKWTTARTLSLSGDASGSVSWDGSANATLSVTVADDSHSHSINTITDEHRLFNNMGDNHGTRTDFNTSYNFGWRYVQGTTNGPGTGGSQFYTVYAGLGNEYPATGASSYGMQIAYPRNVTDPYINIRYRENNSWGTWRKAAAGKADAWTTARTLSLSGDASGSVSWDGSANATLSANITSINNSVTFDGGTSTTISIKCDDGGMAMLRANGDNQGTGAVEVGQSNTYGGGMSYNGDGSPAFVSGETSDHITFYRLENGTRTEVFHYPYSSNTVNFNATPTVGGSSVWHAGNDGSGSGLDADLLDGYHLSTTRDSANTVPVRDGNGYLQLGWINTTSGSTTSTINKIYASYDDYVRYITPATLISQLNLSTTSHNHTYNVNDSWLRDNGDNANVKLYGNSRQMAFRTDGTTEYASGVGGYPFAWMYNGDASGNRIMLLSTAGDLWTSNNGWLSTALSGKLSTTGKAADSTLWDGNQFSSYLNQAVLTTSSPTFSNLYVGDSIYHTGDTDTRLLFGTNTITLQCGGSSEITVNTTGVRLGDTGNGYFQPVTGNYGSIQVDGGAHGSYEGFSIGGRAVFMHDNATKTGIYNDVNNQWLFLATHNGNSRMYYNGSSKIETTSTGATITGDLNSTSDIRYKKNVETIDNALEKVQSLRGVTFDWDNDAFPEGEDTKKPNFTERATGVIAQDVEKVLPEAVRENEDGFKNVAYGNMVGLLIEAIKEQQQQIDELKKQLNG